MLHDLSIVPISNALSNKRLDVVVSGSIGACEAVRFVRCLRRLGAEVFVTLTQGGQQFTTEQALAWASAHPVTTCFRGENPHLASRDAVVVAPASANILSSIAHGATDSPATAMIASYLGLGKPVMAIANMHDSLYANPFFQENLQRLQGKVVFFSARREEGKQKFPSPEVLADEVAHRLKHNDKSVMVSLGTTRGYIDDVRYLSNYSSGKLGSLICEELYRNGFATTAIAGPCPHRPRVASELMPVETNEEMAAAATRQTWDAAVLAASVLDFVPAEKVNGKIKSSQPLTVQFKATDKIIDKVKVKNAKVGFKLEADLAMLDAAKIAGQYMIRCGLSLMVLNSLKEVDANRHRAYLYELRNGEPVLAGDVSGKQAVASAIVRHITEKLT